MFWTIIFTYVAIMVLGTMALSLPPYGMIPINMATGAMMAISTIFITILLLVFPGAIQ